MSITKLGNAEHELISQVDIDSEKISAKSSLCSCLTCDSLSCFQKRKKAVKDRCQCGVCKEIREKPSLPSKDDREINDLESVTKKIIREVVTRETIESLKRVTETMYEFGNDASFRMFMERQYKLNDKIEIPTPTKSQTSIKIESSKKRLIGDSNMNSKDCCKQKPILQAPSTDKTESPKDCCKQKPIVQVPSTDKTESPKDCCKQKPIVQVPSTDKTECPKDCCKQKPIVQVPSTDKTKCPKDCCKQKPIVQVPSTDKTESPKESCTATKLSAQVMNVPYEDLHETVPSSQEITEQNPLSKLNIFKKIKEIYDACSCKVCECISSKPQEIRTDFCKCKPCQCQDCVKLRLKIEEEIKRLPHSGCPCIRCDRTDCRGISKIISEGEACDCRPSDGTQYPDNLAKRCKCEPCQCIKCRLLDLRTSKAVKLGQVDAYIQRETCQCSPCDCIECKQIYNRTNPIIMCTHASGTHKYGNLCPCHNCKERCQFGRTEICKCDSHNIRIRKSFNKNYNDYDIRTVIVDNKGPFNHQKECNFENHNTVALFSSLKNNYPSNSCTKGVCKCTECECIACNARDGSQRNYRDRLKDNVMSLHNDIKLSTSIGNACKCTPCECEICSKKGEHEGSIPLERKCRCDVCYCLNCDNASLATSSFPSSSTPHESYSNHRRAKPIRSMEMNKNCNCNPCDCRNCKKLFSCSSSVKFYSDGKSVEKKTRRSRKVMLVTPTTSESHLKSRKAYVQSVSSTTLSPKQSIEGVFRQDLSTCHAVSHNYAPRSYLSHTNKNHVCQLYKRGKEYNVISDDVVNGEMFFKLNNQVLDTASFISVDETPILNYPCNLSKPPFNTHKITNQEQEEPSEVKYKQFYNLKNLEQADEITSKDSNESLPVYWACCNATSYPISNSRNIRITCKKTKSGLKNSLSNSFNKIHCSTNKDDLNEIPIEKIRNEIFEDKNKLKNGDDFIESVTGSYSAHYNYDTETQNYKDYFSTSPKDIHKEYNKTTVNYSDISIDYESATRVLFEAKAFSSKLIKMLDSFETANKRFESASQKFKVLHEYLLNMNESELIRTYSENLGRTPRPIFENTFGVISEVSNDDKQSTDDSVKNENQAEREYEQSIIKPEDICNNFQNTEESSPNDTTETKNISKVVEKPNGLKLQEKSEMLNICNMKQTQSHFDKLNSTPILKIGKSSQEPLSDDSVNPDSSVNDFNHDLKNKTENKNSDNIIHKTTMASVIKKLDSIFSNNTTMNTSVATDDIEQNLLELSKQQDNQTWQIFKKNLYINPCPKHKRTIYQSSALELDIKEAIQLISIQNKSENCAKVVRRPNEALANLQSEVNDLLNMPLLQNTSKFKYKAEPEMHVFPRSKLDLEAKSLSRTASSQTNDRLITKADKEVNFNINSEKSKVSCDQLKANFIGLRRVSDHTVLVKWSVPKRIADVQGYELLVDGRAVQKIFSATRSMAVVTCLPPAARVLLTVRTLAAPGCGHAPASTIVYRPRMK